MKLRIYQKDFEKEIIKSWRMGARNVLGVLPTGAGKTVSFAKILSDNEGPAVATAHRQELVSQIALALAVRSVEHQIIGPKSVIKFAIQRQLEEIGRDFYRPGAAISVAGVDTLLRKRKLLTDWGKTIGLWVQDEAHHVLQGNKWGKVTNLFPNARGLGMTATPTRADGKGLGREADGVFDCMVIGPNGRELINEGYLTDYRIFAPASQMNLENVKLAANGDYSKPQLFQAVKKSTIVGDVVENYLKIARGKLGVTFAVNVDSATEIAEAYRSAGVPSEVVSHKTPDLLRATILRQFRNRNILQLVNVDLFGEGFDLPAIEVVSFARPTESYSLFCQQFGRALRLMIGETNCDLETKEGRLQAIAECSKKKAIIIDHVGNIVKHGLPDAARPWTLDRRDRKGRMSEVNTLPITACPKCTRVYERFHTVCPHCGYEPIPVNRSTPELVDGDLFELSPEALSQLRDSVAQVDKDPEQYRAELIAKHAPHLGVLKHVKNHKEKQTIQSGLREIMSWWAGLMRSKGLEIRESQKMFFQRFGVDVMTAQTLGQKDASSLADKLLEELIQCQDF